MSSPSPTHHPSQPSRTRSHRATAADSTGWRKRILIVEDDPDLWAIFQRYSAQVDPGLEIDIVGTSDAAIARLSSDVRYDAVVTDFCLPRPKDGRRVQRNVAKLQPQTRLGTVSALMGYKPDDMPFLAKPFTPTQYRHFLRELLA